MLLSVQSCIILSVKSVLQRTSFKRLFEPETPSCLCLTEELEDICIIFFIAKLLNDTSAVYFSIGASFKK